jgi:hypothetical protein
MHSLDDFPPLGSLSPDPFSSPPPTLPPLPASDQEEIDQLMADTPSKAPIQNTGQKGPLYPFGPASSDDILSGHLSFNLRPQKRMEPHPSPGKGPSPRNPPSKVPRISFNTTRLLAPTVIDKINEARDLIIQAITLSKSQDEKTKLLDLVEVFRDYTETGRVPIASKILATQISSLETTARQISTKTRALNSAPIIPAIPAISKIQEKPSKQSPPGTLSYASAASTKPGESWTIVTRKPSRTPQDAIAPSKKLASNRVILIRDPKTGPIQQFSPFSVRNALNKAFSDKGVKGPVIASVTKSTGGNLVLTSTKDFSADFIIEKETIWGSIIPSYKSAQKDEPWHKVILYGIPIADFDTPYRMDLIIEEIKTFNKELNLILIGTPYWKSSPEKRQISCAGSIAVAFAIEAEANRAIRNRLFIAGISVRVEKLYSVSPIRQCSKCQGFGHLDFYYKKSP